MFKVLKTKQPKKKDKDGNPKPMVFTVEAPSNEMVEVEITKEKAQRLVDSTKKQIERTMSRKAELEVQLAKEEAILNAIIEHGEDT